jgi:hypothetical protein
MSDVKKRKAKELITYRCHVQASINKGRWGPIRGVMADFRLVDTLWKDQLMANVFLRVNVLDLYASVYPNSELEVLQPLRDLPAINAAVYIPIFVIDRTAREIYEIQGPVSGRIAGRCQGRFVRNRDLITAAKERRAAK